MNLTWIEFKKNIIDEGSTDSISPAGLGRLCYIRYSNKSGLIFLCFSELLSESALRSLPQSNTIDYYTSEAGETVVQSTDKSLIEQHFYFFLTIVEEYAKNRSVEDAIKMAFSRWKRALTTLTPRIEVAMGLWSELKTIYHLIQRKTFSEIEIIDSWKSPTNESSIDFALPAEYLEIKSALKSDRIHTVSSLEQSTYSSVAENTYYVSYVLEQSERNGTTPAQLQTQILNLLSNDYAKSLFSEKYSISANIIAFAGDFKFKELLPAMKIKSTYIPLITRSHITTLFGESGKIIRNLKYQISLDGMGETF
jgi:hypothetical protein